MKTGMKTRMQKEKERKAQREGIIDLIETETENRRHRREELKGREGKEGLTD